MHAFTDGLAKSAKPKLFCLSKPRDSRRIDPIFFEEESKNFDEAPKFDSDGYNFVEDKIVFGEDDFVIEVVSLFKVPQVFEEVVGDTSVNKSFVNDFSNYQNYVVSLSNYEIKPIEDKFVSDHKPYEEMNFLELWENDEDEDHKRYVQKNDSSIEFEDEFFSTGRELCKLEFVLDYDFLFVR
ncbi:hypothetical protein Sjap_015684 [Stephania japonica]|uniref:Uncharacterized protein n=1 Tax=Stephania japonica TaxID=461633 RepID=A0AAP0NR35_9MAGN